MRGCLAFRCGCFMVVVTIGLIMLGFEGLHEAQAFKRPRVITYEQFVRTNPPEGWFVIKGCALDLSEAMYFTYKSRSSGSGADDEETNDSETSETRSSGGGDGQLPDGAETEKNRSKDRKHTPKEKPKKPKKSDSAGNKNGPKKDGKSAQPHEPEEELPSSDELSTDSPTITRVYLPIHSKSDDGEELSGLVLCTEDAQIMDTVQELVDLERDGTSAAQFKKWGEKNISRLFYVKDLEGMVQAGSHADEKDRAQLARLSGKLTSNFAMLDDGRKPPSTGSAIGMILVGVIVGVVTAAVWIGSFLSGRADRNRPPAVQGYTSPSQSPIVVPYAPLVVFRNQAPPPGGAQGSPGSTPPGSDSSGPQGTTRRPGE